METHGKLIFRVHALTRMAQRGFEPSDVRTVLTSGHVIEEYPDDRPYPSFLLLGWLGQRPVHIVAADNSEEGEIVVITVYQPDSAIWTDGFTRRTI